MDPHGKFIPPTTEEEFLKRAKEIEPAAVEPILDSLKNRRDALVQNIDAEIKFYEKVKKHLNKEDV